MTENINKKLEQIKYIIDNNRNIFEEYKKLIKETEELIFKETCLKPYLTRCEPEFCSFRMLNECKFFKELGKLNSIIQI